MSGLSDITPEELRAMLRDHAAAIAPGEILAVMVPPTWAPDDVRDLSSSLGAAAAEHGIPVLVFPGDAFGVIAPAGDSAGQSPAEIEEGVQRAAALGANLVAKREQDDPQG